MQSWKLDDANSKIKMENDNLKSKIKNKIQNTKVLKF